MIVRDQLLERLAYGTGEGFRPDYRVLALRTDDDVVFHRIQLFAR